MGLMLSSDALRRKWRTCITQGDHNMKDRIIRIVLLMAMLLAAGSVSVQADTYPVPLCYPRPCSVK
jgi:hypothetical protein